MSLRVIYKYISERVGSEPNYSIPAAWLNNGQNGVVKVNAYSFFYDKLSQILDLAKPSVGDYGQPLSQITREQNKGYWVRQAKIYNLFPRLFTAFEHNLEPDEILRRRETQGNTATDDTQSGTFLKTIALLPNLIKQGVNTIHILPINTIGTHGNKGDAGSPYAIKNHYRIEPSLADPLLPHNEDAQFLAFVEACHILGLRVVIELVLRTTARDADFAADHPDWYYWIKADITDQQYTMPQFTEEQLVEIKRIPQGWGVYHAPPQEFKDIFVPAPYPQSVYKNEKGEWIGESNYAPCRIPGAFADWPPDDIQPAWTDVTYLRYFTSDYQEEEDYNYIAYNTIRYYDPKLEVESKINRPLWDYLVNIVPYYQMHFGIDGAMIDMGHAMPVMLKAEMIEKAKALNPDFSFWDESFDISIKNLELGYNAVMGSAWIDVYYPGGLVKTVENALRKSPVVFFGAPENHNTPRAAFRATPSFTKNIWALMCMLPGIAPFIHNGFELSDTLPVNTGLGFTTDETKFFSEQKLPLFNKAKLDWIEGRNISEFINSVFNLRKKIEHLLFDEQLYIHRIAITPQLIALGYPDPEAKKTYWFVVNFDEQAPASVFIPFAANNLFDEIEEKFVHQNMPYFNGCEIVIDAASFILYSTL